jgi:hypothetical protein
MFKVAHWTEDLMKKVQEQKQHVDDYVAVLSMHSQCLSLLIFRDSKAYWFMSRDARGSEGDAGFAGRP